MLGSFILILMVRLIGSEVFLNIVCFTCAEYEFLKYAFSVKIRLIYLSPLLHTYTHMYIHAHTQYLGNPSYKSET